MNGKRIGVVMPAYNAAKTLEKTVRELPAEIDIKIVVDDRSTDDTVNVARKLGLRVFQHDQNYGYGRNQQKCTQPGTTCAGAPGAISGAPVAWAGAYPAAIAEALKLYRDADLAAGGGAPG